MRAPHNAFVELGWLQRLLGREGRANLLVVAGVPAPAPPKRSGALREVFLPGMAGLRVREAGGV